ncbi:MAG: YbjQ family protein [Oscillospiraceae bacterium]|nr:YbjQ family protein [Oscillospiraceae bacterium]
MILVNTDFITGKNIHTLGLVKGSVVWSKHVGRDIMAGFKTIVGGEIKGYTEMMDEARCAATSRMMSEAHNMNADGIINVRYVTCAVMQGMAEVIAYGTAVKFI